MQLLSTLHDFATALNNAEQVDAILLDLSKAFDKVPQISFDNLAQGNNCL